MTAAFEPTQQTPEEQAAALELEWAANPRWEGVTRDYSASDVVRLRGRVSEEHTLARRGSEKLWKQLTEETTTGRYTNALGALTGNQAVQQVKAGLRAIYLSGWQVAADANLSGPDLPGPVAVPGQLGSDRWSAASTTRLLRADQIEFSEGIQKRRGLDGSDRRRRRGRLRRPAQRLRADEVDDHRPALPAFTGKTSWPRRRSAATSVARC